MLTVVLTLATDVFAIVGMVMYLSRKIGWYNRYLDEKHPQEEERPFPNKISRNDTIRAGLFIGYGGLEILKLRCEARRRNTSPLFSYQAALHKLFRSKKVPSPKLKGGKRGILDELLKPVNPFDTVQYPVANK